MTPNCRIKAASTTLNASITFVILSNMKTAVSLPDDIFNEAERAARKAGISRSEFYANAIRTYLDASRKERLTESLNTFYDSFVQEPDPFLRRAAEIQSMRDDLP